MRKYSKNNPLLMIPGPTMVHPEVMNAMSEPVIPHRSEEFSSILGNVYANLRYVFQTRNDVFVFPSSGTGAMCAALENLINPKDKVLSLVCGVFGRRWAQIARNLGADVDIIEVDAGNVNTPDELQKYLSLNRDVKIVTLTHSETSTGVANDVRKLCEVIKKYGAISVVDGISSVGIMDCAMDDIGIDVLVSASQKGFMCPPGLSFLAAGDNAWKLHEKCKKPSFYFNWDFYKDAVKNNSVPCTPAISLIMGLNKALEIIKIEGLSNVKSRHKELSSYLRQNLKNIGLNLLAKDGYSSYAVSAVIRPQEYSIEYIRNKLKNDYNIVVADGQQELKGKIFRIGTIGMITKEDIDYTLMALKNILKR